MTTPDLYVIECPSTGVFSDALTIVETAITLGELAKTSHACRAPHEIHPAEDMPALKRIATDIAANRAPF